MDNQDFGALTLEQQFQLRQMVDVINRMTLEQAQSSFKEFMEMSMRRENMYKEFITQEMLRPVKIESQDIQL